MHDDRVRVSVGGSAGRNNIPLARIGSDVTIVVVLDTRSRFWTVAIRLHDNDGSETRSYRPLLTRSRPQYSLRVFSSSPTVSLAVFLRPCQWCSVSISSSFPFRRSTKTRTQGATLQYCIVKRSYLPCPAAQSISGTSSEGESGRNLTCILFFFFWLVCHLFVHSEQVNVYFTLDDAMRCVIVHWISTGPSVGATRCLTREPIV